MTCIKNRKIYTYKEQHVKKIEKSLHVEVDM